MKLISIKTQDIYFIRNLGKKNMMCLLQDEFI